ncbi:hypothetical protein AYO22_00794 [Fonsecaea multimorphosa]|nr:hypothetical protein AYO22_00794 [Fonsecaea multimorphosa]
MVKSNSSLERLVEAMHSMLLQPKKETVPPAPLMDIDDSLESPSGFLAETPTTRTRGLDSREIQSVAAYRAPLVVLNTISTGANTAASAMPSILPDHDVRPRVRAVSAGVAPAPSPSFQPRISRKELPPTIASINIKRQTQGARALADLKSSLVPKPRPSFLDPIIPTFAQLSEGLEYVFTPLPRSTGRQLEIARQTRISELELWIQSLDRLINTLAIPPTGSAIESHKSRVSEQRSDLISLLSQMNGAIESLAPNVRNMVYEVLSVKQVDPILHRAVPLTKSVRTQKEVEEFMEERSAWLGGHTAR